MGCSSEYWSAEAYHGVDRLLRSGCAVIVMSGNTMFWRVSYDEDGAAMECRKYGNDIGGRESAQMGEAFHSHDHKRGSLMRFCGMPAWNVLGLECIGWWPIQDRYFGSYKTVAADHFLFRRPEAVDLSDGYVFGEAAGGSLPRVGGHESDVRLSLIRSIIQQAPPGVSIPNEPEGVVALAQVMGEGR